MTLEHKEHKDLDPETPIFETSKMESIHAIFFVSLESNIDILMMVYRPQPEIDVYKPKSEKLVAKVRLRYPDNIKSVWRIKADKPENNTVEYMVGCSRKFIKSILEKLRGKYGKPLINDEILIKDGSVDKAMNLMAKKPWAQMKLRRIKVR